MIEYQCSVLLRTGKNMCGLHHYFQGHEPRGMLDGDLLPENGSSDSETPPLDDGRLSCARAV